MLIQECAKFQEKILIFRVNFNKKSNLCVDITIRKPRNQLTLAKSAYEIKSLRNGQNFFLPNESIYVYKGVCIIS